MNTEHLFQTLIKAEYQRYFIGGRLGKRGEERKSATKRHMLEMERRWRSLGEAAVSASFCTVVLWKDVVKVNCARDELDHCAGVNESPAWRWHR